MRHLTIRLLAVAAVAAISLPAYAQSPIQLRFNVQPAANDPVWQSFKGQTLEKYAECYYSNDASRAAGWNPGRSTIFSGKTVLFNPGNTTWSGGKQVFTPNTPPEPTNTLLMLPAGLSAQTKSIVCRARILANGQNVTANVNDIVFRLTDEVAKSGPPVASVQLDVSKAPKPAPAKATVTVSELRISGTSFVLTAANPQIIVDRSALEKSGKAKCVASGTNAGCTFEIEWTVFRDNKEGELKVSSGGQQNYFGQNGVINSVAFTGKPPILTFAPGADKSTASTGNIFAQYYVAGQVVGPQKLPNCNRLSVTNSWPAGSTSFVNKPAYFTICINNK